MLEVGVKAPDFKLPDQNGDMHTLDEFKGKKLLLYRTAGISLLLRRNVFERRN